MAEKEVRSAEPEVRPEVREDGPGVDPAPSMEAVRAAIPPEPPPDPTYLALEHFGGPTREAAAALEAGVFDTPVTGPAGPGAAVDAPALEAFEGQGPVAGGDPYAAMNTKTRLLGDNGTALRVDGGLTLAQLIDRDRRWGVGASLTNPGGVGVRRNGENGGYFIGSTNPLRWQDGTYGVGLNWSDNTVIGASITDRRTEGVHADDEAVGVHERDTNGFSFDLGQSFGTDWVAGFSIGASETDGVGRTLVGPAAEELRTTLGREPTAEEIREALSERAATASGVGDLADGGYLGLAPGELLSFDHGEAWNVGVGAGYGLGYLGAGFGRDSNQTLRVGALGDGQFSFSMTAGEGVSAQLAAGIGPAGLFLGGRDASEQGFGFTVDATTEEGQAAIEQFLSTGVLPGAESQEAMAEQWTEVQRLRDVLAQVDPNDPRAAGEIMHQALGYQGHWENGPHPTDMLAMLQARMGGLVGEINGSFVPELGASTNGVTYERHTAAETDSFNAGASLFGRSAILYGDSDTLGVERTLGPDGREQRTYTGHHADSGALVTDHALDLRVGPDGLVLSGRTDDTGFDPSRVLDVGEGNAPMAELRDQWEVTGTRVDINLSPEQLAEVLRANGDALRHTVADPASGLGMEGDRQAAASVMARGLFMNNGLIPEAERARVAEILQSEDPIGLLSEDGGGLSEAARDGLLQAFMDGTRNFQLPEGTGLTTADTFGMIGVLYGNDTDAANLRVAQLMNELERREDFDAVGTLVEYIETRAPDPAAILGTSSLNQEWAPDSGRASSLIGADMEAMIAARPQDALTAAASDPALLRELVTRPDFDAAFALDRLGNDPAIRGALVAAGLDPDALDAKVGSLNMISPVATFLDPTAPNGFGDNTMIYRLGGLREGNPYRDQFVDLVRQDPSLLFDPLRSVTAAQVAGDLANPEFEGVRDLAYAEFGAATASLMEFSRAIETGDADAVQTALGGRDMFEVMANGRVFLEGALSSGDPQVVSSVADALLSGTTGTPEERAAAVAAQLSGARIDPRHLEAILVRHLAGQS